MRGETVTGTIELQSTNYLNAGGGRIEFQIRMKRGWGALQKYHVIGLKNGLLLLNIGATVASTGQFDGTLGLAGGLIGGKLGRAFGNALETASESPLSMADNNFSMCSDDELIQKAKSTNHKGSLVCTYDEIDSMSIDKRGTVGAWTRGGVVAALITVRTQSLGKMVWEVCDQQSLLTASEALPAKLNGKVECNVIFDRATMKFVQRKA